MSGDSPPSEYVTAWALRELFNEGQYFERLQAGEFTADIRDQRAAPSRYPAGTRSQIIRYLDSNGRTVAIIHQYGTPDGMPISGSLPDPKYLFQDGTRYKLG
jgi:hypothetical protein